MASVNTIVVVLAVEEIPPFVSNVRDGHARVCLIVFPNYDLGDEGAEQVN